MYKFYVGTILIKEDNNILSLTRTFFAKNENEAVGLLLSIDEVKNRTILFKSIGEIDLASVNKELNELNNK